MMGNPASGALDTPRDHGGGIDAARQRFGGGRGDWLDLSTGINPSPYPRPGLSRDCWTALPDSAAAARLEIAARRFWRIPDGAAVLAAPGASALIARIPALVPAGSVAIPGPTYNEHAAAFTAAGWTLTDGPATAKVLVHPNNPTGRLWPGDEIGKTALTLIDESFCDVCPEESLVANATRPGVIILKSFGKFWGLAGLRLGFAIAHPETVDVLSCMLGPWPISGPALEIGAAALEDPDWAAGTRHRLAGDSARLDRLMLDAGAGLVGGTALFRLYDVGSAQAWQDKLARHHIWSRIFPYSERWLRLGLPPADGWKRLEAAV